jgi:DNA gyrase subunit A
MLITNGATLIRSRVDEVRVMGRNTQGVTLIKLSKGELLAGMQRIEELPEEEGVVTENEDSEVVSSEVTSEANNETIADATDDSDESNTEQTDD